MGLGTGMPKSSISSSDSSEPGIPAPSPGPVLSGPNLPEPGITELELPEFRLTAIGLSVFKLPEPVLTGSLSPMPSCILLGALPAVLCPTLSSAISSYPKLLVYVLLLKLFISLSKSPLVSLLYKLTESF